MYQKLEKPYIFRTTRRKYIVHLGEDCMWFCDNFAGGIVRIGSSSWHGEYDKEEFEGGAVVAPSPIILWDE